MAKKYHPAADCIVEVTVTFFKKGDKASMSDIENLDSLCEKSWEDASKEIPKVNPKDPVDEMYCSNHMDLAYDTEFIEDWVGVEFQVVSWSVHDCGAEGSIQNIGTQETFGYFGKELLEIAKKLQETNRKGEAVPFVRFLTAWSYHTSGSSSVFGDDDFDCWVELMGWIDPTKVFLAVAEPPQWKPVESVGDFKFLKK